YNRFTLNLEVSMMITLKEIAQEANVSPMTVSNVINGNLKRVSKETADRVHAIIKKNNYVPNSAARTLSTKSSMMIALCIADNFYTDLANENYSQSPYNIDMIGIIQHFVEAEGYVLLLCGGETPQEIIDNMKTWKVAGAIFLAGFDSFIPKIEKELGVPTVFLDNVYSDGAISSINIDDYYGGVLAARFLLNQGHQNLAFASNIIHENPLLELRYKGFLEAHRQKNKDFDVNCVFNGPITYEGGIKIGKEIARHPEITGVVATADVLAIGIIEGIRLSGLSVPDDISIIGFDDIPMAKFVSPKLTTIKQNMLEKGKLTTEELFRLIEDPKALPERKMLPVEIVERFSTKNLN
ncbi:LacI family DNA-binding transcriptional regulator, partial [Enterococcus sp. 3H8_DIV0648]|uniref:LacI family DNA-binding transcriptional regulator n=2 Tax=Enterococcus TaxID=1350 RepID=UPI001C38CC3F